MRYTGRQIIAAGESELNTIELVESEHINKWLKPNLSTIQSNQSTFQQIYENPSQYIEI